MDWFTGYWFNGMARNPSPTTELSLSFEALRLNHEKKKEEEDEEEAGKDFIS